MSYDSFGGYSVPKPIYMNPPRKKRPLPTPYGLIPPEESAEENPFNVKVMPNYPAIDTGPLLKPLAPAQEMGYSKPSAPAQEMGHDHVDVKRPIGMISRIGNALSRAKNFITGQGRQFLREQAGNEEPKSGLDIGRVLRALAGAAVIQGVGGQEGAQVATGMVEAIKGLRERRRKAQNEREDRILKRQNIQSQIDERKTMGTARLMSEGRGMLDKIKGLFGGGKIGPAFKPANPPVQRFDAAGKALVAEHEAELASLAAEGAGMIRSGKVSGLVQPNSPHDLFPMKDVIKRSLEPFASLSNADWEKVWPSFRHEMFPHDPTTAETAQAQADAAVAGNKAPKTLTRDILESLAGAGKKAISFIHYPSPYAWENLTQPPKWGMMGKIRN